MAAYLELLAATIPARQAAALTGVSRATIHRKHNPKSKADRAQVAPLNKLTETETTRLLETLNDNRFVDLAPLEIYAHLLDEGTYLCSVSTMYRTLAAHNQINQRRRQARHRPRVRPELVASGPGQVCWWDITKRAGPVKGKYYDAYVILDIYSRYIVGIQVRDRESGLLAAEMMKHVFGIHGIPEVVHADRGTSMTSKTVAALLADLEVTRSHARPKVSNDNPPPSFRFAKSGWYPQIESQFKTLKYTHTFPERFGSLVDAQRFMDHFVDEYNHNHSSQGVLHV